MKSKAFEFQPQRLNDALIIRGVKGKDLAARIKRTPQAITRFLKGQSSPSFGTLKEIADALNFPRHYFCIPIPESVQNFRKRVLFFCTTEGHKRCDIELQEQVTEDQADAKA